MPEIRGTWTTPRAREMSRPSELTGALEDYRDHGPQFVSGRGGEGFAFYKMDDGRVLLLAERRGLVTLMTFDEFGEEVRKLRDPQGESDQ